MLTHSYLYERFTDLQMNACKSCTLSWRRKTILSLPRPCAKNRRHLGRRPPLPPPPSTHPKLPPVLSMHQRPGQLCQISIYWLWRAKRFIAHFRADSRENEREFLSLRRIKAISRGQQRRCLAPPAARRRQKNSEREREKEKEKSS